MPRLRLTFRERDLASAIRVAKAQGITVARYEIKQDGTIVIIPGEPEQPAIPPAAPPTNPDEDPETLALDEAFKNAKF